MSAAAGIKELTKTHKKLGKALENLGYGYGEACSSSRDNTAKLLEEQMTKILKTIETLGKQP